MLTRSTPPAPRFALTRPHARSRLRGSYTWPISECASRARIPFPTTWLAGMRPEYPRPSAASVIASATISPALLLARDRTQSDHSHRDSFPRSTPFGSPPAAAPTRRSQGVPGFLLFPGSAVPRVTPTSRTASPATSPRGLYAQLPSPVGRDRTRPPGVTRRTFPPRRPHTPSNVPAVRVAELSHCRVPHPPRTTATATWRRRILAQRRAGAGGPERTARPGRGWRSPAGGRCRRRPYWRGCGRRGRTPLTRRAWCGR